MEEEPSNEIQNHEMSLKQELDVALKLDSREFKSDAVMTSIK